MTVTVTAPAKLNLTLDICGRREDGYHELYTIMQTVDLADTVTLTAGKTAGIRLLLSDRRLPNDERNTAYKAAALFLEAIHMPEWGVHIAVQKRIPMQAGMAGGSADAAAVLVGMNALTGANMTMDELCALGARVGADVPFCVRGGTAVATGTGTTLRPIAPMPDCTVLIAKPAVGVSTAMAYENVDKAPVLHRPDNEAMERAIAEGRLADMGALLCNVFEEAMALPEVAAIRDVMRQSPAVGSAMTGSGSAVFALFEKKADAQICAEQLRPLARRVVCCRPCEGGAVIVK